MRRALAALLAGAIAALTATPAHAADQPDQTAEQPERLFRWGDPAIRESSGLVDLGSRMVTVNDSGDSARLFVVDGSGAPLRTIAFADEAVDVEALAPAGPGHVWVGDIGDNRRERPFVSVHRVRIDPGPGPLTRSYRLAYPDGLRQDAESLLQLPDGRLVVITKGLLGGTAYAAPADLRSDRVNRLRPVGRVAELATDAALGPDGRTVLVRGPASMGTYALPSWDRVATTPLPPQPQGEGLSVGPDGRVRVSSEGVGSWVWQLPAPAAPTPAVPRISPDAGAALKGTDLVERAVEAIEEPPWRWAIVAVVGIAAIGMGIALRQRER